ncbi:MAG TPA: hypothetical protein VI542_23530 [Candidatus Tectomicrobia bacterium]
MPNVRISFHPAAVAEVEAAVQWYAERSPVAARAFAVEVNACVERVGEAPERWPRYVHGTRRYLFPHFPKKVVAGDPSLQWGEESNVALQTQQFRTTISI